ncbi:MAG: hypothetical protein BWY46_01989 [Firmicutes bacterium ADurb.Bin300]|nr:MAG: hypothetical protein BWY46_01989 [Firmicutes bacterium ADurb.Bin300]
MRTASLVLGIIGGVLAVIFALIFMASGALVGSLGGAFEIEGNLPADQAAGLVASSLYIIGGLSIVGAVLGIVGGAMAKKKNILAGIFLIVAAIPSLFTGLGIIASILFIIGGVFAFIPQKDKQAAAE